MKRFTCINDREEMVDGAIKGTKEQVLAWMKKTFPGMRERGESEMMSALEFFHEGEITAYKTADGESVYLVEIEKGQETMKKTETKKMQQVEKQLRVNRKTVTRSCGCGN